MNELIQNKNYLIGSQKAIIELEQKESANILVLSDSHGDAEVLQKVITECGILADALFFCGDGIADLCSILNKTFLDESLKTFLPPVISIVQGNCDTGEYKLYTQDDAIKVPLFQVVTVCNHKVFCTHGHHFSLYGGVNSLSSMAENMQAPLALFGHTHIASMQKEKKTMFLNPGSCARPRAGQPPCFAMIKIKSNTTDFIYTFYRITETKSFVFEL